MLQKNLLLIIIAFLSMCQPKVQDAGAIVQKCIETHGGDLYDNSVIDFDFRGRHYRLERNQGNFTYHRIFTDSAGTYHDILTNEDFHRTLNDSTVTLTAEWIRRYSNSVNSVAYFALLPFGLNDPAVNKNLMGEEEIDGNHYYKIRVTFNRDGGGEDFEDVFVYWINKSNFMMDFFGYSYQTDGGGIRFREAANVREVSGIIFSDYINYKGKDDDTDVGGLAGKFKKGALEKMSEIRLENLTVSRAEER
jgi:hypothetical protein